MLCIQVCIQFVVIENWIVALTQQTFASWPDDDDYKNWLAKNPILFVDVVGLDQILSDISELSLFHNPDWPKVFAYLTDGQWVDAPRHH